MICSFYTIHTSHGSAILQSFQTTEEAEIRGIKYPAQESHRFDVSATNSCVLQPPGSVLCFMFTLPHCINLSCNFPGTGSHSLRAPRYETPIYFSQFPLNTDARLNKGLALVSPSPGPAVPRCACPIPPPKRPLAHF